MYLGLPVLFIAVLSFDCARQTSPADYEIATPQASDGTITVNAGPDKALAFPAKDLTLFGHATESNDKPLSVQWMMTSGPGPVTFSAPRALATTVTFSRTGAYAVQLSATNGAVTATSSAVITVTTASSQTAFYVDPTYTGAVQNGSAKAPWKSLLDSDSDYQSKWNAIKSALASNDVIIYFSARTAGSDTSEQFMVPHGAVLFVNRGCRADTTKCTKGADMAGTHRLTLDGMSMYNANDAVPNWLSYTGTSKFRVNCANTCDSMSLGWDDDNQRDYVTIRGFEVTGPGSRIRWGGNYSYMEYMWIHDVSTIGATLQFNQAVGEDGHGCPSFGRDHDITIRNNLIERGFGEGIYFGGNYLQVRYGGCPSYGNTHSDILIEGNTITDTATNGGEGDGIDLKAGLMNVTVRNNVVSQTHGSGTCIVSEGVFPPAETHYRIEGNRCTSIAGWSVIALMAQNGTVIRNNILSTNPGRPAIYILEQDPGIYPNNNISIYNNTLYNTSGLAIDHATNVALRNNILLGNSGTINRHSVTNYSSDYNFFSPAGPWLREGPHSTSRSTTAGVVVDAAGADFHLTSTSAAKDKGIDLSMSANVAAGSETFNSDFDNVTRPQGSPWDIGAYEFRSGIPAASSAPTPGQSGQH
jgi:hypothetical protein